METCALELVRGEYMFFVFPYFCSHGFGFDFVFGLQLKNTNEEQKSRIQKLERALKVAEVLDMVVLMPTCILWILIVPILAFFLSILTS